jgi:hypothetical protein
VNNLTTVSINCTFMKIEILAVLNLSNNYLLIKKGDLLWLKWSNYALKLQNGKIKVSQVSTVRKNANNSITINYTFMKIEIPVVVNPPNNYLLIKKGNLLWPKWSNYALKLENRKIKVSQVSIVRRNANNSTIINYTLMKIKILVVPNQPNNYLLIKKDDLLWPK